MRGRRELLAQGAVQAAYTYHEPSPCAAANHQRTSACMPRWALGAGSSVELKGDKTASSVSFRR